MAGAPSHLELFDYKPQLAKFDGTLPPPELLAGYRAAFINPNSKLLGPKFKFRRYGKSCDTEMSELLPFLGEIVDDVAIVKSMVTDAFNHAPGQLLMNTGTMQFGRPSMGSWTLYGLGSWRRATCPVSWSSVPESKDRAAATVAWAAASLPTVYQGVEFRTGGDPVLYLSNPRGVDRELQRDSLDALKGAQPDASRRHGRSRSLDAHQLFRDAGVPYAGRRARSDGHREGAQGDARPLRRGARQSLIRK